MAKIAKNVNITLGLNNALEPSSSGYKEGLAYVSDNSRLDKENVWNKGPSLVSTSSAPTAKTVPSKTGKHFADMSVLGNHIIAAGLDNSDTIAEGSNGYGYFLASGVPKYWNGDATSGTVGLSAPTLPTADVSTNKGARQEEGLYYYLFTAYNATRDVESIASAVIEHWVRRYYSLDVRQADVPKVKATSTGNTIRIYRSLKIEANKGDSLQLGQKNSPTKFYYVGEVASATYFNDYAHDDEIKNENDLYTGRGSKPPQSSVDVIASFQNRMFYFVDNVVYWSSAGRPEECPQGYNLSVEQTYTVGDWDDLSFVAGTKSTLTVEEMPLLDTGLVGAAKMTLPELTGHTVVRAQEIGNKLWVFTADMTGYIVATAKYEGFRFVKVAEGVGLCSPWTLSVSKGGVYGADKKGIWQLEKEYPVRLSYGVIDIDDSNKSTYCDSDNLAASFGVWVDELNEYLWSVNSVQIAYQADRGVFVGPYALILTGGCSFVTSGGAQCYLTGGKTASISTRTGVQTLKFWLGQESFNIVKDKLNIEVVYNGITADKNVTAKVYQNNIASETGASESNSQSHNDDDLIGRIPAWGSGRFFEVSLSVPTDCIAPLTALNYTAEAVPASEKAQR